MVETVAIVLGIVSLGVSVALLRRLNDFERRLRSTERALESATPLLIPELKMPNPLRGLRAALAISQDHPHPIFGNLLKEQLLSEDVTDVAFLSPAEAVELRSAWGDGGPDLLIVGELTCNGYAEIYYQADFTCYSPREAICTVVERPPHGDRPANLAIELVTKLKQELKKLEAGTERRRALRELGDA